MVRPSLARIVLTVLRRSLKSRLPAKSSLEAAVLSSGEENMNVDLPQISPTQVEPGKTKETLPVPRPLPQSSHSVVAQGNGDETSPAPSIFGPGGTYSIASLKAAAEHQAKYFAVAESNIFAATKSTSRIPEALRQLGR
jgi:hypothetical protein